MNRLLVVVVSLGVACAGAAGDEDLRRAVDQHCQALESKVRAAAEHYKETGEFESGADFGTLDGAASIAEHAWFCADATRRGADLATLSSDLVIACGALHRANKTDKASMSDALDRVVALLHDINSHPLK